jgi:1-acyl-sn-glycerol-3-phosphate acyltransferase
MTTERSSPDRNAATVAQPSRMLLSLFHLYLPWYFERHFHGLRIAHASRIGLHRGPLIVYMNHPSWWDPLVALVIARRFFSDMNQYGPMDAATLKHYGILRRMGMFPVEQGTRRGAVRFLEASNEILSTQNSVLWITPQGCFTDVRSRPVFFKSGLAALLSQRPRTTVIPLAVEYTFWDERLPEILANAGEPFEVSGASTPDGLTTLLTSKLAEAQDELASLSVQRCADKFETVIRGGAGITGIYELWQRLQARLRREAYQPEHGRISRP